MNKQKFTQIVENHTNISTDDREQLQAVAAEYPYSQIIHTLVAKANTDANTKLAKSTLGFAAMYATDRSVLKEIIVSSKTAKASPDKAKVPKSKKASTTTQPAKASTSQSNRSDEQTVTIKPIQPSSKVTIDPDTIPQSDFHLSQEVMHDLEDLSNSKRKYEEWVELYEKGIIEEKPKSTKQPTKQSTKGGTSKEEETSTTQQSVKTATKRKKTSKKETETKSKENKQTTASKSKTKPSSKLSADKKKATTPKPKATTTKTAKAPKAKTTAAKKKTNEASEKQKQTTVKKPTSDTTEKEPNQKEQIELIEKFISKEPSITAKAARKSSSNQEDLSKPSTEFKEDLVSENLAKIMITQGKVEKAVEIYKKLIWKFPQKKSYFATQIEELNK